MGLFGSLGRRPHVWLSPVFNSPADLGARLIAEGFADLGGTYAMVQAEGSVARRFLVAPRRLAAAAAIVVAIGAGALVWERNHVATGLSPSVRAEVRPHIELATKPVVETYDSKNATIVEVPREAKNDPQVVMIFDESLPADL